MNSGTLFEYVLSTLHTIIHECVQNLREYFVFNEQNI